IAKLYVRPRPPVGRAREIRRLIQGSSPEIWPETISDSEEVLARKWVAYFWVTSFRKNLSDSRGEAACARGIVPFTHLTREWRMTVTIGRRELLAALGGAAAAWPLAARAQQPAKLPRVGLVSAQSRSAPNNAAFEKRLAELGYQDGKDFIFDF